MNATLCAPRGRHDIVDGPTGTDSAAVKDFKAAEIESPIIAFGIIEFSQHCVWTVGLSNEKHVLFDFFIESIRVWIHVTEKIDVTAIQANLVELL